MSTELDLRPLRRRLVGHGALLILAGGVIGFGFLFFLIGEIRLWPIPGKISYQMPGSLKAWRMSHLEAIINGAILWITAAVLPLMPVSAVGARRVSNGLIVVAWTFVLGSLCDALFVNSRGLVESDVLTNNIAFGLFYVGVVLVMVIMGVIAYRSLLAPDDSAMTQDRPLP